MSTLDLYVISYYKDNGGTPVLMFFAKHNAVSLAAHAAREAAAGKAVVIGEVPDYIVQESPEPTRVVI